nr:SspA [Streptomyces spectabilis]
MTAKMRRILSSKNRPARKWYWY